MVCRAIAITVVIYAIFHRAIDSLDMLAIRGGTFVELVHF